MTVISKQRRAWQLQCDHNDDLTTHAFIHEHDFPSLTPVDILTHSSDFATSTPPARSHQPPPTKSHLSRATTWTEFTHHLPPWERPFFNDIRIEHPYHAADLFDFFNQETLPLLMVSDGSSPNQDLGTYGWILGTKDHILARSAGHATGYPMDSHRAEGFGKLASLLFLQRFTEYLHITATCTITLYLDNQSVQSKTAPPYDKPLDNLHDSMCTNYDVLNEIRHLQQKLRPIFPKMQPTRHIHGHQDRNTPHHQLSRPAYLNVLADHEATTIRDATLAGTMTPPPFQPLPHCQAYIHEGNKYHCSHERTLTLWRYSELQYHDYLCKRLAISRPRLDDINWHPLRLAQQRLDATQQRFLPKFLTDWLPTEHKLQRYTTSDGRCPFCKDQTEDVDHFLRCRHATSPVHSLRTDLAKQLTTLNTDPALRATILDEVTLWLAQTPSPNPILQLVQRPRTSLQRFLRIKPTNDSFLQEASNHQRQLGWRLWLRGLHSYKWAEIQGRYSTANPHLNLKDPDGITWNRRLIEWQIIYFHNAWKTRRQLIAPIDEARDRLEAQNQVTKLYQLADDLSPHDQKLFRTPLVERLQQPTPKLRQWIRSNHQLIHKLRDDRMKRLKSQQPDIRDYFTTKPPPPKPPIPKPTQDSSTGSAKT